MTPSKCTGCGAAVPAVPGPYTCGFCGAQFQVIDELGVQSSAAEAQAQASLVEAQARMMEAADRLVRDAAMERSQPPSPLGPHPAVRKGSGIVSWLFTFVVILVALFVFLARSGTTPVPRGQVGQVAKAGWDGRTTLICTGNEDLTFEGKDGTVPGTAVIASGNCRLRLVACHLHGAAGMLVGGGAHVSLVRSSIEGSSLGLNASGDAQVVAEGGAIEGRSVGITVTGNAVVELRGVHTAGQIHREGNGTVTSR